MHEQRKPKLLLRKIIFTSLFYFIDLFLYVGEQTKKLYEFYKVPNRKLVPILHSVDNERFISFFEKNKQYKNEFRVNMGVPVDKTILLCVGKLISIKRTLDLVKALKILNDKSIGIIFVGEGEKRTEIQAYIDEHKLENVTISGFINQTQIVKYYLIADIYVMCSESETWGLSTNEAMCSNLPIILSDTIGGAEDLVSPFNGTTYPSGDIDQLVKAIKTIKERFCDKGEECKSQEIVKNYSFEAIAQSLVSITRN